VRPQIEAARREQTEMHAWAQRKSALLNDYPRRLRESVEHLLAASSK
jgi:hypothetical protein